MTRKGTVGNCAVYPSNFEPGIMHSDLLRMRIDPKRCASSFLVYQLHRSQDVSRQLSLISGGAIMPGINVGRLKQLEVIVPPLAEQKRIAAILDAADALRTKRREALAQLDALLQSSFLTLFGDPVSNPMGWETPSLGSICDVRDGTHDSPKYVAEGRALLTSKNFKDGAIDYSGANFISESDFIQINKRSKVDKGDLVMPMIGTIGNPVLVETEPDFAIKNVALIKFYEKSPDNRFIRTLLCSHYFDHITAKANRGGTQKFVALKDRRAMEGQGSVRRMACPCSHGPARHSGHRDHRAARGSAPLLADPL